MQIVYLTGFIDFIFTLKFKCKPTITRLLSSLKEVMITQRILPSLTRIVRDSNFYVRSAAASAIPALAPIVGKKL